MARSNQGEKYSSFLSEDEDLKLIIGYSSIHLREQFITYLLFPGIIFIAIGLGITYLKNTQLIYGATGGLIVACLISLILTIIMDYSHKYLLTTRRVIVKEGFLKIKLASVLYDKVTHITVDQGFLERLILGYGTVRIDTAGSSGDELTLQYVAEPIKFKNRLENLIHRHQSLSPGKSRLLKSFEEGFVDLGKRGRN